MNSNFYKVVDIFKGILEDIQVVNSVIYARAEEKDLYKNTKFPLVHINPTTSPYENSKVTMFSFEIGAFTQRIDGEDRGDFRDNNIIDNHNTTYAILNEFLTIIDRAQDIYEVVNVAPLRPIFLSDSNGLDGWVTLVTISLINDLDIC